MILLDTNVISELMKPASDSHVMRWVDRQVASTLYLASTSLAELMAGIAILPEDKRKQGLANVLVVLRERWLDQRILNFDEPAAEAYGLLVSRARAKGRVFSIADGQIAAIAQVHGFAVATRDTEPFEATGVAVINPWEAYPSHTQPRRRATS